MSLALDTVTRRFTVTTTRCDGTRANLQVCGHADRAGAEILEAVLDGHLRAGRRYLRVDVGGTSALDEAALSVLCDVHRRLLAARGTLIITAVRPPLEQLLATANSSLFVLPVNVADGVGD
jgi:anti-anti-sigma regulatory factor